MFLIRRASAALVLSIGTAAIVLAQAPTLNTKPGLWEMAVSVGLPPGGIPGLDTSKMTPEQRAQAEVMMRGMAAMKPIVTQSCVTKDDLAQGRVQKDPPGSSCKTTVTKQTATLIEMTQTCTGSAAGTREMRIEALTPTTMKVVSKAVTGPGAGTTATITGKWLSANCGDVK